MEKIATPQELVSELRQLLEYARSANPSREKLASELQKVAAKVAPRQVKGYDPSFFTVSRRLGPLVKDLSDETIKLISHRGTGSETIEALTKMLDGYNRVLRRFGLEDHYLTDRKALAAAIINDAVEVKITVKLTELGKIIDSHLGNG